MGGLEDEKLGRGLDRAGSLRPLPIRAEPRCSLSSASPRRSCIGWTGAVVGCGPHLETRKIKLGTGWPQALKRSGQVGGNCLVLPAT